jgi:ribosomal-protein-alanine N-acetyltransferase
MFRLRDYRPGDFERLYALDQSCFDPQLAYSRAELRFYVRHPATFTIVADQSQPAETDDNAIAGFLIAHRRRGGVGHVITIDVDAPYRRSRVGTLLMEEAERRLREQGCSAVTLETAVDNVAAISFYMKRGYSITHTLRGYYSNGLDALVMRKELHS